MSNETIVFDVFFSYARKDAASALKLIAALKKSLTVWYDSERVEDFGEIAPAVRDGISNAKCIVCFYTETYPTRRACNWEVAAAYTLASANKLVGNRVLVINLEKGHDHIPGPLRECLYKALAIDAPLSDIESLARVVSEHVSGLKGALGTLGSCQAPKWFPVPSTAWPRFENRMDELWEIHSTLRGNKATGMTGVQAPVPTMVLVGMPGSGKSLLAEEYAIRFGLAYQGGVFWLRGPATAADHEAALLRQYLHMLDALGLDSTNSNLHKARHQIIDWVDRCECDVLWVVDGMPEGMSLEHVRSWIGPHSRCHTIITTTSTVYRLGGQSTVGSLSESHAFDLVLRHVSEVSQGEDSIRSLVRMVGGHPLACEILGAWVRVAGLAAVLDAMKAVEQDALGAAGAFADELPLGQLRDVTRLLLASVASVDGPALDCLVLASHLAPYPISLGTLVESMSVYGRGHEAPLGLRELERKSLVRQVRPGVWDVHVLLRRTVRVVLGRERHYDEMRRIVTVGVARSLEKLMYGDMWNAHTDMAHAMFLIEACSGEDLVGLGLPVVRHLISSGVWGDAIKWCQRAVVAAVGSYGEWHSKVVELTALLVSSCIGAGHLDMAEAIVDKALPNAEAKSGEGDYSLAMLWNSKAHLLRLKGGNVEAIDLLVRARDLLKSRYGADHNLVISTTNNLAVALQANGDVAQATELQEALVREVAERWGEEHLYTCIAKVNHAATLSLSGDVAEAVALCRGVVEVYRRHLGIRSFNTLQALQMLGDLLLRHGRAEESERMLREAMHVADDLLGKAHYLSCMIAVTLSGALVSLGSRDEALQLAERLRGLPAGFRPMPRSI